MCHAPQDDASREEEQLKESIQEYVREWIESTEKVNRELAADWLPKPEDMTLGLLRRFVMDIEKLHHDAGATPGFFHGRYTSSQITAINRRSYLINETPGIKALQKYLNIELGEYVTAKGLNGFYHRLSLKLLKPFDEIDHLTITEALAILSQRPSATPATPAPPIVLGGPDDAPIVRGIEKDILTPTQYQVVKVLVDAFPSRVAGDSLARRSDTEDPVSVIDRLSRDKDWASVLSKPGKAHGGYGIVSTPRKTQKDRKTRPRKPRG